MLNKDLIKELAKKIDSLFDWQKIIKNGIVGTAVEFADGLVIGYGLDYLNENYGKYIPLEYTDEIEEMIRAFIAGDYLGMLNAIPEGFDQAIDIKFFDDDFEAVFIATNFNAIVKAAIYYAEKKKEKAG